MGGGGTDPFIRKTTTKPVFGSLSTRQGQTCQEGRNGNTPHPGIITWGTATGVTRMIGGLETEPCEEGLRDLECSVGRNGNWKGWERWMLAKHLKVIT